MKLKFKQSARYNANYTNLRNAFVYSIDIIYVVSLSTRFNLSVGLCIH